MTAIPHPQSRRDWLLSETPQSRHQARLGQAYRTWLALKSNRLAMLGLAIILALVLIAALADVIAPFSPTQGGDLRTERLLAPNWTHLLGTDDQARDIFSRLVYG
ncbi:D,D-dipeptide ABC transporter permease, partial [Thioclava sp. BHET1]